MCHITKKKKKKKNHCMWDSKMWGIFKTGELMNS